MDWFYHFDLLDELLLEHEIATNPALSALMALTDMMIDGDETSGLLAGLLSDPTPLEMAEMDADCGM